MRTCLVVVALTAGELVAAGQPAPAEPPAPPSAQPGPPPPVVSVGGYPAMLPQRPLAMPRGKVELIGVASITDSESFFDRDPIDGGVSVRVGLGRVELEARATAHLRAAFDDDGLDTLATLGGAARFVAHPDFTIGADVTVYQPTQDEPRVLDVRGLIARKLRLSEVTAVEGRAGASNYRRPSSDISRFALVAQGRIQVAASSRLSLEAGIDLQIAVDPPDSNPTNTTTAYGGRVLFTTTAVDVFLALQVSPSQFLSDFKLISLGVQGRVP